MEVYPGVSFEGLVEPPADQATSSEQHFTGVFSFYLQCNFVYETITLLVTKVVGVLTVKYGRPSVFLAGRPGAGLV